MQQYNFHDDLLARYLPPEHHERLLGAAPESMAERETFAHLAAVRYVVGTYLPQVVLAQSLAPGATPDWIHHTEGALLFADLSGSTALAEQMSRHGREGSEQITAVLNGLFATLIGVIERFGGDLIAFGGDALLVAFTDTGHARTAVEAALALQEALHDFRHPVLLALQQPIHLHIGVEQGALWFLSVGHTTTRHATVTGGCVSRTVQAEMQAGPGELVLGPACAAATATPGTLLPGGFLRVTAAPPAALPAPASEPPQYHHSPARAIPQLLHDLERLRPYLPEAVLARVISDPQRPRIEAELRPVTVLFAHVDEVVPALAQVPPEELLVIIDTIVTFVQTTVERYGGVLNKLDIAERGIKMMSLFGAPIAYEDHAARAGLAALAIREGLAAIAAQAGAGQLQLRAGLNTGTVFAGNVGSETRQEYTVMGDTVNVAARVMSAAPWGEVWCSAATATASRGRLALGEHASVAVRGKSEPLELAQVRGEWQQHNFDTGALVGREPEQATLAAALEAASAGRGSVLRIIGEAGVGKSRLVAALVAQAEARQVPVITAACFAYTETMPYAAWGEWLKCYCDFAPGEPDATRVAKLHTTLEAAEPGLGQWLPLLADILRLDVPDSALTRAIEPQLRQTRIIELFEALIRASSATPIVMLFEDMHWMDAASLELWQRVAPQVAPRPLLMIAAHRPDVAPNDGARIIHLHELSADQSRTLAESLGASAHLGEHELATLVARAGGNPLFLRELIRAVVEDGQRPDELPDSLNGLLLARIDRLDEASRGVLRIASVIGQRVPFGVLRSVHSADQQALVRMLTRLDDEELTHLERESPERVYAFRHALIQEVAYQSMLYSRRRELHGRIGQYLEQQHATQIEEYVGLLAHHYRFSDDQEKAVVYLLRAGDAARAIFANEEAIQYYRWAIEALQDAPDDLRRGEAHESLGDVLATIGRYEAALAEYGAVLGDSAATTAMQQRAHRKHGSTCEKQGLYDAAMRSLETAAACATGDALETALIAADVALVHRRRGSYDAAITAIEQGLAAISAASSDARRDQIEARLHSELGGIHGMRGEYPRARHHFERSLTLRALNDDLPGMAASHNNLGYLWQLQSQYARALEEYTRASAIAERINLRFMIIFASNNAASSLISMCRYTEARSFSSRALELARSLGDRQNTALAHDTLGAIAYQLGDYADSLIHYHTALAIHHDLGSSYQQANALMNSALTYLAQHRFQQAHTTATQALEQASRLHANRLIAESLNVLAEVELARGNAPIALQYAEQATTLCRTLTSHADLAMALMLLGRAQHATGEPYRAALQESMDLAAGDGNQFIYGRVLAGCAQVLQQSEPQQAAIYQNMARQAFVEIGAAGELRNLAAPEPS